MPNDTTKFNIAVATSEPRYALSELFYRKKRKILVVNPFLTTLVI